MNTDAWDVMINAPGLLTGTLLLALDDAIAVRRDRFTFCADCRWAADGLCAEHRDDSAIADDYEAAKVIVASARPA